MIKWLSCHIVTCFSFSSDIEAQIRDIQNKKKDVADGIEAKEKRVGLGESGYFDSDIYDGGGKFEGYVRSIAVNDEVDVSICSFTWSMISMLSNTL